jgi:ParB family chromosome partitioning protein
LHPSCSRHWRLAKSLSTRQSLRRDISDQEIQARVFEQVSSGYYAPSADSIRRMVLSGTVRGSDPRARLVGREAYIAAGGRIERELFDDDDSESWVDVALLEASPRQEMERRRPSCSPPSRVLPGSSLRSIPMPATIWSKAWSGFQPSRRRLTEAELARLDELDASYDEHAAILEDEDSAEEAVAAAEAAIEAIERECQEIRAKPAGLAPELKAEAGMILVLSRDGTPVLQPVFYGERRHEPVEADDGIEVVARRGRFGQSAGSALSKRLVDELAMQRRDVLALHVASDPGLALDIMVFTLADADTHDWRARGCDHAARACPAGPIIGFEAKDAPASSALAELRSNLDESWRAGEDATSRFDLFRALPMTAAPHGLAMSSPGRSRRASTWQASVSCRSRIIWAA